jgi:hypothetical protein
VVNDGQTENTTSRTAPTVQAYKSPAPAAGNNPAMANDGQIGNPTSRTCPTFQAYRFPAPAAFTLPTAGPSQGEHIEKQLVACTLKPQSVGNGVGGWKSTHLTSGNIHI